VGEKGKRRKRRKKQHHLIIRETRYILQKITLKNESLALSYRGDGKDGKDPEVLSARRRAETLPSSTSGKKSRGKGRGESR